MSRGKCRTCATPISVFYPGIEIAALAIAAWTILVVPGDYVWPSVLFGWMLLTLAAIDWRTLTLPDVLTMPLAAGGLLATFLVAPELIVEHVAAVAVGFGILWLVRTVYRRFRGIEGLGMGDAKLFAAIGAWVGLTGLASVLLVASLSGLVFVASRSMLSGNHDPGRKIPFGAFLALGGWIVWCSPSWPLRQIRVFC